MRPSLSIKTTLRAPFKTLLTFLLIAAATFAVFSRVADYAVTQREMERATSYYRGVAALDTGTPNTALLMGSCLPINIEFYKEKAPPPSLTAEQVDAFSSLPEVSGTDIRYMTAGVIEELKRVARYGTYEQMYDYTDRFVVEGTYTGYTPTIASGGWGMNLINLSDCRWLAGEVPKKDGGETSIIAATSDGGMSITYQDLRVFVYLKPNLYHQGFVDNLSVGERCVIIGRWSPKHLFDVTKDGIEHMNLFIGDFDSLEYCDSYVSIEGKPENYLETQEYSSLKQIVDITNRDLKTLDMVYTSDLLSIPRFNEKKMVIQEGRAITPEDSGEVCVVSSALAEINGLKVGDKLSAGLCDKIFNQHSEMGATAVVPDRYGEIAKTAELEIVGIYADVDPDYERIGSMWWSYSPNTIFVPKSLLPTEIPSDYEIKPGEFSIIINDAHMMRQFVEHAKPLAKEMGIKSLRFSDRGWLAAEESMDTGRTMSLLTTILFICAAAVALLLAIYMYIEREKKNFAIMRALGTPQRKARYTLVLPLCALSVLSIPLGGITGMIYAHDAIAQALESLSEAVTSEYVPNSSLPVGAMLLCLLCEVGFLTVVSALYLKKLSKTPPLSLLQGNAIRVKMKKSVAVMPSGEEIPLAQNVQFQNLSVPASVLPKQGTYSAFKHVSRYVLRHMKRAGFRTALAVVLTVILTGASGVFAVTKLSYQELFNQTEVTGTLTNYSSDSIPEAAKSELMKDFYFSGGFTVICNDVFTEIGYYLTVTNDFERYVQSKTEDDYSVEYAEGSDSTFASGNDAKVVIGGMLADILGVRPGDRISALSWAVAEGLTKLYRNDKNKLDEQTIQSGREFEVIGIIYSEDVNIGLGLFTPLSETVDEMDPYFNAAFPIEFAEFKLVDKENPSELTDYLVQLSDRYYAYPEVMSYHMETSELNNIKRVRDMLVMLFPIAVAAAVMVGLTAPMLIIMQSAKEAAILRLLGTTKRRAICILAIEQISLCVLGLIIAAIVLVSYNAGLFVRSSDTLALCGALYMLGCACAAVFAAVSVTRSKVLELLQVKE